MPLFIMGVPIVEWLEKNVKSPVREDIGEEEIDKLGEEYADSHERRGCSYWSGLFTGFKAGLKHKTQ